jgi:hypothetical protein
VLPRAAEPDSPVPARPASVPAMERMTTPTDRPALPAGATRIASIIIATLP